MNQGKIVIAVNRQFGIEKWALVGRTGGQFYLCVRVPLHLVLPRSGLHVPVEYLDLPYFRASPAPVESM